MSRIEKNILRIGILAALVACLAPTQAMGQFPAYDLIPKVDMVDPANWSSAGYKTVPPSLTIRFDALDPDGDDGRAKRYRLLFKDAQYDTNALGDPVYIRTPFDYHLHGDEVLSYGDPGWSDWQDVPPAPEPIEVQLNDLPDGVYYFLSIQLLDGDGTTNETFEYQVGTFHFRVGYGSIDPEIVIHEPFLGNSITTEASYEIAAGQPINFSWTFNSPYGAEILYRHGWDLVDPEDPNDPGWAVPPGTGDANMFAQERTFQSGVHTFTLRAEDSSGAVRVMRRHLTVIPYVSYAYQLPLLVIDQTVDANLQNWPDQSGRPRNDEAYRNAWWQFLQAGPGGVAGIYWDRDWMDHRESPRYSDLVKYRVVLCYAELNYNQTMFQQFRPQNGPVDGQDQFVWLTPYQMKGGNLFLVGGTSMDSFLEIAPNYMVPTIFDTDETYFYGSYPGEAEYVVGFGVTTRPDGTVLPRGPRMYPYATAGISALDWTSPNTKYIYGRERTARYDRNVDCAGLKGLVLEPDFKVRHGIGPGVVPDTLWTDAEIDWQDHVATESGNLALFTGAFPFRADEFVDANISPRTTPFVPQDCPDGPEGLCVEPMFRGIARFDFVREHHWENGNSDWPTNAYTMGELLDGCGNYALTSYEGQQNLSARTNGRVFGFMSHKMVADKPVPRPDVYWGFDPYRFDHEDSKKAVRWVLQYLGLQINP